MRAASIGMAAAAALALVVACSGSSSSGAGDGGGGGLGSGSGPNGAFTCDGTPPAMGGVISVSLNHACGPADTQATKMPGEACTSASECAPTCCACPGNTRSAQVQACDATTKTCASHGALCCAFATNDCSRDD